MSAHISRSCLMLLGLAGTLNTLASPFAEVIAEKRRSRGCFIDFARTSAAQFVMKSGAFLDAEEPLQLETGPRGLTVRVDAAREKVGTRWATMSLPKTLTAGDVTGRRFSLVVPARSGRVAQNVAINVTDAQGETFQFSPEHVASAYPSEGERMFFNFVPAKGQKGWGGIVNDGVMDRPAWISAVNFHYRGGGTGVCVLKAIEGAEDEGSVLRTTVSIEPISTDTQSPGAEPFPGADELAFMVEPAFTGLATLVLSTESTGMAHQGRMIEYAGTGTVGRIRFKTGQPWTKQYQFMGIRYCPSTESPKGPYRIVKAGGRFLQTKAEALRLEVDTKNELHLCRDGSERPELLVSNPTDETIAWKTYFVLSDVFGREIRLPFERFVRAGETVRIAVPWPLPAKGLWVVKAQVLDLDGRTAEKETRFAYIDRHEVTPLVTKPKFRFGIHYHGTQYWPDKIDKTIAALVAAGAKFTRCDYSHMWADIEKRPGEYDWEKADAMVEKLRTAGLSLDIIMQSIPRFAYDPETFAKAGGWRRQGQRVRGGCLKIKPGLFRAFCERYARRYGTKIDYYEVGNEWDLTSAESFPHEVALAIQREAYEGLHAGCPDVCVTSNGWGFPYTDPDATPDRYNPGIIEFFADHPETYDCWALHCHGSFAKYVSALDGGFMALRNRTKLKTRPWISNETANTIVGGNDVAVSRQVWQKPLWAWSRGCRDYIWYNLRATGWFDGGEPGFGLITAGFYPRATYAAFAALTTIFQGLDYDGSLYSHRLRHLLRFKGTSQGLPEGGLVLVGWDDQAAPDAVRMIRIRTDAKKAELSDYMGNRSPKSIVDGVVAFPMTFQPQALILSGVTVAEAADARELSRSLGGSRRIDVSNPDRAPDFTIGDKEHVHSFYEANPPYAHRLWAGSDDLSANVWLNRRDGKVFVRVEVTDDKPASGDRVEVTVETAGHGSRAFDLKRVGRQGDRSVYEQALPVAEREFGFDLRVYEDDGEGTDGYLMLCREGEDPVQVVLEGEPVSRVPSVSP